MIELDEADIKILKELQKNSRLSFEELSKRVGISKSTIYRKVKRMEELGIIRRYTISIDHSVFGKEIVAFVLIKTEPDKIPSVASKLTRFRDVLSVYRITGEYNILAKLATPSVESLNQLVKKFHEFGAKETVTIVVLEKFLDEGEDFTQDL